MQTIQLDYFRRRKGVYGPSMGKKIILAFDDFERSVNSGNTENIVELLRQLLERKFWYDPKDACRVELIDFVSDSSYLVDGHILHNFFYCY